MNIASNIWRARNDWIFNEKRWNVLSILRNLVDGWNSLLLALEHREGPQRSFIPSISHWTLPCQGCYKAKANIAMGKDDKRGVA